MLGHLISKDNRVDPHSWPDVSLQEFLPCGLAQFVALLENKASPNYRWVQENLGKTLLASNWESAVLQELGKQQGYFLNF